MEQEQPKKKSLIPLFLVLGSFVALGAGINVYTIWKWRRQVALEGSPTVSGEVLGKLSSTSTKGSGSYSVRYRYKAPDPEGKARKYESHQTVDVNIYRLARKGGPITVSYLADDPSVSSIGGSPSLHLWLITCVLMDGAFAVFVFVIVRMEWRARRKKRESPQG